jgi:endonuclease VIII
VPEGDTILRTARTLDRALAGKTVTRFDSVFPALLRVDDETPLRGRNVERVTATGKHLVIEFSGGLLLRTHMRMNGSWHIYRTGERWRRPHSDMRIVIATDEYEAVGFNVPVAEFMTSSEVLDSLGPDILKADFDATEAIRRMRLHDAEEIANVLLNQRAVAGIGNIYKSESLFAANVNPFDTVASLDDAELGRILKHARSIMRRAASGPRDRLAVYDRGGQPCRKCGSRIEYRRQGAGARGTYWCPKCQASRKIRAHAD